MNNSAARRNGGFLDGIAVFTGEAIRLFFVLEALEPLFDKFLFRNWQSRHHKDV